MGDIPNYADIAPQICGFQSKVNTQIGPT